MGMDLLNVLHREDHGVPSLSMVVNIPTLKSLDVLVHQFEEALDNDFPKYQACPLLYNFELIFFLCSLEPFCDSI
jgi:hypothetical protein